MFCWEPLVTSKPNKSLETDDWGLWIFKKQSTHYEYTRGTLGQLVGKLEMYLRVFGDLILWLYFYQIIR